MIDDVNLEMAILDYICKTAGPDHLDLIERIKIETERHWIEPEDLTPTIKPLEDFTNE